MEWTSGRIVDMVDIIACFFGSAGVVDVSWVKLSNSMSSMYSLVLTSKNFFYGFCDGGRSLKL